MDIVQTNGSELKDTHSDEGAAELFTSSNHLMEEERKSQFESITTDNRDINDNTVRDKCKQSLINSVSENATCRINVVNETKSIVADMHCTTNGYGKSNHLYTSSHGNPSITLPWNERTSEGTFGKTQPHRLLNNQRHPGKSYTELEANGDESNQHKYKPTGDNAHFYNKSVSAGYRFMSPSMDRHVNIGGDGSRPMIDTTSTQIAGDVCFNAKNDSVKNVESWQKNVHAIGVPWISPNNTSLNAHRPSLMENPTPNYPIDNHYSDQSKMKEVVGMCKSPADNEFTMDPNIIKPYVNKRSKMYVNSPDFSKKSPTVPMIPCWTTQSNEYIAGVEGVLRSSAKLSAHGVDEYKQVPTQIMSNLKVEAPDFNGMLLPDAQADPTCRTDKHGSIPTFHCGKEMILNQDNFHVLRKELNYIEDLQLKHPLKYNQTTIKPTQIHNDVPSKPMNYELQRKEVSGQFQKLYVNSPEFSTKNFAVRKPATSGHQDVNQGLEKPYIAQIQKMPMEDVLSLKSVNRSIGTNILPPNRHPTPIEINDPGKLQRPPSFAFPTDTPTSVTKPYSQGSMARDNIYSKSDHLSISPFQCQQMNILARTTQRVNNNSLCVPSQRIELESVNIQMQASTKLISTQTKRLDSSTKMTGPTMHKMVYNCCGDISSRPPHYPPHMKDFVNRMPRSLSPLILPQKVLSSVQQDSGCDCGPQYTMNSKSDWADKGVGSLRNYRSQNKNGMFESGLGSQNIAQPQVLVTQQNTVKLPVSNLPKFRDILISDPSYAINMKNSNLNQRPACPQVMIPAHDLKRESPLDLSVKTVKTSADSTGCCQEPFSLMMNPIKPNNSLKVNYVPNFDQSRQFHGTNTQLYDVSPQNKVAAKPSVLNTSSDIANTQGNVLHTASTLGSELSSLEFIPEIVEHIPKFRESPLFENSDGYQSSAYSKYNANSLVMPRFCDPTQRGERIRHTDVTHFSLGQPYILKSLEIDDLDNALMTRNRLDDTKKTHSITSIQRPLVLAKESISNSGFPMCTVVDCAKKEQDLPQVSSQLQINTNVNGIPQETGLKECNDTTGPLNVHNLQTSSMFSANMGLSSNKMPIEKTQNQSGFRQEYIQNVPISNPTTNRILPLPSFPSEAFGNDLEASADKALRNHSANKDVIFKLKSTIEEKLNQKRIQKIESDVQQNRADSVSNIARFRTKGELKGFLGPSDKIQNQNIESTGDWNSMGLVVDPPPENVFASGFNVNDWGSTCNDFVQQLQTGKKRPKRKLFIQKSSEIFESNNVPGHRDVTHAKESLVPRHVIENASKVVECPVSSSDDNQPLVMIKKRRLQMAMPTPTYGDVNTGADNTQEIGISCTKDLKKKRLLHEKRHAARFINATSSEDETDEQSKLIRRKRNLGKLQTRLRQRIFRKSKSAATSCHNIKETEHKCLGLSDNESCLKRSPSDRDNEVPKHIDTSIAVSGSNRMVYKRTKSSPSPQKGVGCATGPDPLNKGHKSRRVGALKGKIPSAKFTHEEHMTRFRKKQKLAEEKATRLVLRNDKVVGQNQIVGVPNKHKPNSNTTVTEKLDSKSSINHNTSSNDEESPKCQSFRIKRGNIIGTR